MKTTLTCHRIPHKTEIAVIVKVWSGAGVWCPRRCERHSVWLVDPWGAVEERFTKRSSFFSLAIQRDYITQIPQRLELSQIGCEWKRCAQGFLWKTSLMIVFVFPTASVTNYHRLSYLKQHSFVLLTSSGRESEIGFTGLKSGCSQSWFLLEDLVGNPFPCFFSGSCLHALAHGPFLTPTSWILTSPPSTFDLLASLLWGC